LTRSEDRARAGASATGAAPGPATFESALSRARDAAPSEPETAGARGPRSGCAEATGAGSSGPARRCTTEAARAAGAPSTLRADGAPLVRTVPAATPLERGAAGSGAKGLGSGTTSRRPAGLGGRTRIRRGACAEELLHPGEQLGDGGGGGELDGLQQGHLQSKPVL